MKQSRQKRGIVVEFQEPGIAHPGVVGYGEKCPECGNRHEIPGLGTAFLEGLERGHVPRIVARVRKARRLGWKKIDGTSVRRWLALLAEEGLTGKQALAQERQFDAVGRKFEAIAVDGGTVEFIGQRPSSRRSQQNATGD